MRILVITGTFHPEPGGPPTYLYHLLPELQARGHEVKVLTYGETDDSDDYPYPVRRVTRQQSIPARLVAFAKMIWQDARWADVCFVQDYTLPVLPAKARFGRPIVTKIVSDSAWEFSQRHDLIAPAVDVATFQGMPLPWRVKPVRWQQVGGLRLAKGVIAPSSHVASLVTGWGIPAERVHVILNAAPPEPDLPDPAAARAELSLPANGSLLLSVGRLTAVKGFDVAIRALPLLDDAVLVIIGDGEDRKLLADLATEKGVADRVIFLGRRSHREVMMAMRACDVFVLSSHTEGLSHVLLEALSDDKAAVATAVGGNPEILTDGLDGLLVPPNDPAQLAGAIQRLLDDPDLAERIRAGAAVRSQAFSWGTLVERTEALLQAACDE